MNAPATMIDGATKERPILFSGPMIRAILDGRKTQTRRIVKPQPLPELREQDGFWFADGLYVWKRRITYNVSITSQARCPFGVPGDRLWVRETHAIVPASAYRCSREPDGSLVPHRASPDGLDWAIYREGWTRTAPRPWRPSIHMPRWASRVSLEVTEVRVERLQAISEEDARAEGCELSVQSGPSAIARRPYATAFAGLWDAINGAGSWASNPWVWCVSFRRVEVR